MTAARIKLCGVRTESCALACAEAGADEVGVVFAPGSPRRVTPEQARRIRAALPPQVPLVGVFQDAALAQLAEAIRAAGLSAVQLHGALPAAAELASLQVPVYRALHGLAFEPLEAPGRFARVLLDGPRGGGRGERLDWSAVPAARAWTRAPLFLAGGLDPDNVAAAIAQARPDGVDVASGIEGPDGLKDPIRARTFVAAARAAFASATGASRWI